MNKEKTTRAVSYTHLAGKDTSEAICMSVAEIASKFQVAAIIAFTESGFTARKMSRYRPEARIIAATPIVNTTRSLALDVYKRQPNVATNQKVIVANPGCDLGNGFIIKESKIRGVESNGMICSIAELGLDQRLLKPEDKEGIHVLDDNAPVGEDPLEYIGLKDTILEIGLTPNRADCMALTSFAYEVGAILKRDVNLPKIETKGIDGSGINVKVDTDLRCV